VSSTLAIGLVRAYQVALSPFAGGACRFTPSCSAYAIEAIQQHGAVRGLWLAITRVVRCHPWGGFGHDPVPLPHAHACGSQVPSQHGPGDRSLEC
jgi:uncharacterized protein